MENLTNKLLISVDHPERIYYVQKSKEDSGCVYVQTCNEEGNLKPGSRMKIWYFDKFNEDGTVSLKTCHTYMGWRSDDFEVVD